MSANVQTCEDSPFLRQTLRLLRFEFADLVDSLYGAGSHVPMHKHDFSMVSLTLSGGYSEMRGQRQLEYGPWTTSFRPVEEEHSVKVGSRDLRCFNVGFAPHVISQLAGAGGSEEFIHTEDGPLPWLMNRLYELVGVWGNTMPVIAEGLVLEILGTVAKMNGPENDRQQPRWMRRLEELVRAEFRSTLTVHGLAARLDVHPVHLSRTWRRFRGCSLGQSLHRLRIDAACRRLVDGDDSLADIALQHGFADQTHFSQVFKRITGTTPGAYRSSARRRARSIGPGLLSLLTGRWRCEVAVNIDDDVE